jgi:hypothetical protein
MSSRREHPRATRLVLRVGVTGHRTEGLQKLGADLAHLRRTVRQVLEMVRETTHDIWEGAGSDFYSQEEPLLRLISPLAEGADRIVAEEALALGYDLQCLLPFSREEYELDFSHRESKEHFWQLLPTTVLELDGDPKRRSEAYLAVGKTLLRHCDLLIAIWDGAPARGEGGTGQVVQEALRLKVPTVLIETQPPHRAYLLEAGTQSGEPAQLASLEGLSRRLQSELLLPSTPDRVRAKRFLGEMKPIWNYGSYFQIFRYFWTGQWSKILSVRLRLPNADKLSYFDWTDDLAEFYAGLSRSSVLLIYLMGAFATDVAAFGVVSGQRVWFISELVFVVLIMSSVAIARRKNWEERWKEYRFLAESLRTLDVLAMIGRVPSQSKASTHMKSRDTRQGWYNWQLRALVRKAGLVSARIDRRYLEDYRDFLQRTIAFQTEYLRSIREALDRLSYRLRHASQLLFGLAAIACTMEIVDQFSLINERLLVFCSICLPAFGVAFWAILHHGEFERMALRAEAVGARLEELQERLREAELDTIHLGGIAEAFVEVINSLDRLYYPKFSFKLASFWLKPLQH